MNMKNLWIAALVLLVGLLAWNLAASAQDRPDLDAARAKINELRERAERAAADGRPDEARELKQAAENAARQIEQAVRQQRGDRPDQRQANERFLREAHEQAERLEHEAREQAEAGHREQAERIQRQLQELRVNVERHEAEMRAGGPRPGPGGPDDVPQRIAHLREASAHLDAAGEHELAVDVAHHADEMEEHFRQAMQEHGGDPGVPQVIHELARQLDELRHAVEQLNQRVEELSRQRR